MHGISILLTFKFSLPQPPNFTHPQNTDTSHSTRYMINTNQRRHRTNLISNMVNENLSNISHCANAIRWESFSSTGCQPFYEWIDLEVNRQCIIHRHPHQTLRKGKLQTFKMLNSEKGNKEREKIPNRFDFHSNFHSNIIQRYRRSTRSSEGVEGGGSRFMSLLSVVQFPPPGWDSFFYSICHIEH